jgi:penicillin-binding protein 1C
VETGAVRALVGSPDYFSLERRGALNAAVQRRSPGSALKPFLYALAFGEGVVGPAGLLVDTPLQVAAYIPENYDRRFHGPVSAREALSLSLNVPAVRLQWKLGTETVLNTLHRLGLETLNRPARDYGLALTLGAGEVRLVDLAAAYATLVRLGRHLPWRVLEKAPAPDPPAREGRQVLSAGACRLVLECLSGDAHLLRAIPDRTAGDGSFLGYKTGTSFGLRDAWALAFTRYHVAGVWIGDPRGRSTPGLVGAATALPVAASIAAELARDTPGGVPGDGRIDKLLRSWPICATSGYPAGKACPRTLIGRFPRGSPLPDVCSFHREIRIEPLSGREVCAACARGRSTVNRVVEVWPNEVDSWLSRQGVRRSGGLPAHEPDCPVATTLGRPTILSPTDGSEFLISHSPAAGRTLFLTAAASGEVTRLHWFVDGELLARTHPLDEVPWKLRRGGHEIRCIDERGRAAVVRIRVR